MQNGRKSKLRKAWAMLRQVNHHEENGMILGMFIALSIAILIIIRMHLYREPLFFASVAAMTGWLFLGRSRKWTKFHSYLKIPQKIGAYVDLFLISLLALGGWGVFTYFLGIRLGGGINMMETAFALLFVFMGVTVLWRLAQVVYRTIRND